MSQARLNVRSAKTSWPPRLRRSQESRSRATQDRLLEATIRCLAEVGYGRLTTSLVCDRAGLTRGAQMHHFPTKALLVRAAVERLSATVVAAYDAQMALVGPDEDPIEAFCDGIWQTLEGPLFETGLELLVAARTDPELRPSVELAAEQLREITEARVVSVAAQAKPSNPGPLAERLRLGPHLIQAFGLDGVLSQRTARNRRLFDLWKADVRRCVETQT